MAIATARVIGRDFTVECGGVTSVWSTISVKSTFDKADATAADSEFKEKVLTQRERTYSIKGFVGSANNSGNLPAEGDAVTLPTLTVGEDDLVVDGGYTNFKVISTNYDLKNDAAEWSFEVESGVLN